MTEYVNTRRKKTYISGRQSCDAWNDSVYGLQKTISYIDVAGKASFSNDLNSTYRFYLFTKFPELRRSTKIGFGIISISILIIRLIIQVKILFQLFTKSERGLFDEASNHRFSSISLDLTAFCCLFDILNQDTKKFVRKVDITLSKWKICWHHQFTVEVAKGKKLIDYLICVYIAFQISMSILSLYTLTQTFAGRTLFLFVGTKVVIYVMLIYMMLFVYRMSIFSLYMSLGFRCIARQLDRKYSQQSLDVKLIRQCRNYYEELADLIREYNNNHSLLINGLIITITARLTTSVYDVVLSGLGLQVIRFLITTTSLFRLSLIVYAAKSIHEASLVPRAYLQNIILDENNAPLFCEIYLFLDRIKTSRIGIKIMNHFVIDRSIAPTIFTVIISYFIAVGSLNRNKGA